MYLILSTLLAFGWILAQPELAFSSEQPSIRGKSLSNHQYLSAQIARNFIVASGTKNFSSGYAHPLIGYHYISPDLWSMSISGQFKIVYQKQTEEEERQEVEPKTIEEDVALFTVTHSISKLIPLYVDHFMFLGPSLLYFYPSRLATIPTVPGSGLQPDLGVSLQLGYLFRIEKNSLLMLKIDRWRGTASTKLQGIEVSFGSVIQI